MNTVRNDMYSYSVMFVPANHWQPHGLSSSFPEQ